MPYDHGPTGSNRKGKRYSKNPKCDHYWDLSGWYTVNFWFFVSESEPTFECIRCFKLKIRIGTWHQYLYYKNRETISKRRQSFFTLFPPMPAIAGRLASESLHVKKTSPEGSQGPIVAPGSDPEETV